MKILALFSILIISTFGSCKFGGNADDSNKQKQMHDQKLENFRTKNKPGKWKKEANSHVPQVTVKKKEKNYEIHVIVPFIGTSTPVHYIETIILLNHHYKELQKVTFNTGNSTATTVFKIPRTYKSYLWVVAKCNLHDMWKKQVVLE